MAVKELNSLTLRITYFKRKLYPKDLKKGPHKNLQIDVYSIIAKLGRN